MSLSSVALTVATSTQAIATWNTKTAYQHSLFVEYKQTVITLWPFNSNQCHASKPCIPSLSFSLPRNTWIVLMRCVFKHVSRNKRFGLIKIYQNIQRKISYQQNEVLTFWSRNYFFLILAHPVYKMWIIQEPNTLDLWNKLHFEEEKTESIYHV